MTPSQRITVIHKSLRVFHCGLASLLPVIGLFPAACALVGSWQLRRYTGFNPGRKYAKWGYSLALLGILITIIFALMAIIQQLNNYDHGSSYYRDND